MMSSETCAKCGAELLVGGRFCRRCGEPSRSSPQSSITEAETRVFQATADRPSQTEYHEPRPTGPSYMAPNDGAPLSPSATTALERPKPKRNVVLWASAIIVVVLLLFGGVVALMLNRTSTSPTPATRIDVPPPAGIVPPVPPVPPVPSTAETRVPSALDYPGAVVTMEMTRRDEGGIRQLRTSDAFEKVVAWYREKLKPLNDMVTPDKAVLTGKSTSVVISRGAGETTILLKDGIDR